MKIWKEYIIFNSDFYLLNRQKGKAVVINKLILPTTSLSESIKGFKECHKHKIFQIHNKEMVDELSKWIKSNNYQKVVEIGAGDGYLSELLRNEGVDVIAVDDNSWNISENFSNVEILNHKEACEKYNPDLVILCWEPMDSTISLDVLKGWKQFSGCDVLFIGEIQHGCTGPEQLWEKDYTIIKEITKYCFSRTDIPVGQRTYCVLFKKENK